MSYRIECRFANLTIAVEAPTAQEALDLYDAAKHAECPDADAPEPSPAVLPQPKRPKRRK